MDTTSVSPSKSILSELLKPDIQVVSKKLSTSAPISNTVNDEGPHTIIQPLPAHTNSRELGVPSTNNDLLRKAYVENFSDSHQEITVQQALDFKEGKSKANSSPAKRVHTFPPGLGRGPSPQQPLMSDSIKDASKFDICIDRPGRVLAPIEEQQSFPKETNSRPLLDMSPAQISTRSRVDESGSPSRLSSAAAGTVQTFERRPLQELQQPTNQKEWVELPTKSRASLKHSLPWPPQTTSDSEPQLVRTDIPLLTDHVPQTQAGNMGGLKSIENLENHRLMPNAASRIVLSPSSSSGHPAERPNDLVSQVPRLNPRSIDFASRIARQQKVIKYNQDDGEEALNGREDYKPSKRPSWLQSNVSLKPRDDPKLLPPKADKTGHILEDQYLKGHGGRQNNPAPKPVYETKWQDAVDAASGGVVDTLHFISMNLLEHLRTREQSVFAVVNEYKRNGTKVSEKLSKRQTGEWLSASTAVEQKCSELATLYEGLSKKTQDFRGKCLSKHRNQAYIEWQRQTARIKGAIRTAREEAFLG
ncbi:hypothetical protein M434DRAFT_396649 [Hypoxylon sp. CO27-5]|nr:hypothetical protein M434DRAFT_396649 [Hypoxylon sp. CO27-5]